MLHIVEMTEIYTHTFLTKISRKQRFTKEVKYERVYFTKYSSVRVNFRGFHIVVSALPFFREIEISLFTVLVKKCYVSAKMLEFS